MHYYKFNIGDYASHTRHLSLMEDLAYRRLLDVAYTSEKPLTKDSHALARLIGMRDHKSEVEDVLREFFEEVEEGWIHGRVLKEIEESGGRSDKAKIAAKARWESKRNADAMQDQCSEHSTSIDENASSMKNDATQDPLPITHYQLPIKNTPSDYSDEFEQAWSAYPKREGASKKDSYKAWNARLRAGVLPSVIIEGVMRYAAYCVANGTESRFIKQAATFFGPGEHYLAEWSVSKTGDRKIPQSENFELKDYGEGITKL